MTSSKVYKEIENFISDIVNSKNGEKVQFFYDDGKITQIRFLLEDSNPQIINKEIMISKIHFTDFMSLVYTKVYFKNDKKIIEHYTNHDLSCYYEIETTSDYKIATGFSSKGEMFCEQKIEYNSEGKPITEERLICNADGTTTNEKFDLE